MLFKGSLKEPIPPVTYMVLTAGSMFQSYQAFDPSINSFFLETVWVPLISPE